MKGKGRTYANEKCDESAASGASFSVKKSGELERKWAIGTALQNESGWRGETCLGPRGSSTATNRCESDTQKPCRAWGVSKKTGKPVHLKKGSVLSCFMGGGLDRCYGGVRQVLGKKNRKETFWGEYLAGRRELGQIRSWER